MGKGDKKTRRGKVFQKSFGKTRPKKEKKRKAKARKSS
ncbi:MAG: 30S ribosomal protein THX [Gemmatimonadetes bacterium]|nr:30S ribosomal protein THX [Gemmatimonadota bacterium]NNM04987.1 30S ribosomal protein THX [Gemmatimonadota bacterium]